VSWSIRGTKPLFVFTSSQIPFSDIAFRVSASEEYWYKNTLNIDITNGHVNTDNNSWSNWGSVRWEITGCLAFSWVLICLSLIGGVQSYGKVVYFTTLFPYVVLTITLGYVATLDGFVDGIDYYLNPKDWDNLYDVNVWNDAAGQIFYSLSVAQGTQLALASYNSFSNNCHRDAILIGICNSLTSLYAGFSVFGVIGYIADAKGAEIEDVVSQGPGLAFIVYPEALALMDVAPLFSFLFFFMLILLAISSVCGSTEALVAAFLDEFPQLKTKYRRLAVLVISCIIAFLVGFIMCFDSGLFLFSLMDKRCSNAILLMAFVEVVAVSWFYGADNMLRHVKEMGMDLHPMVASYWKICWVFFMPVILFAVTILSWVNFEPDGVEDYEFPSAVQFLGWCLELYPLITVIVCSIYFTWKRFSSGQEWAYMSTGPMMKPNKEWGPRGDSGLPLHSWRGEENHAYNGDKQ